MRTPGYHVTLKLFVPTPRTNFRAQAEAAELMELLVETKMLPDVWPSGMIVTDVAGKYGSAEITEATQEPAPPSDGTEPRPPEGETDAPVTELASKRRRA